MLAILQSLEFTWPWAFLLLPLPLLSYLPRTPGTTHLNEHSEHASSQEYSSNTVRVSPILANALGESEKSTRTRLRLQDLLLWCSWVCLIAAISQPSTPTEVTAQAASGRAITLAIDLSGSMERKDFVLDGVTSNRLDAVKKIASDFLMRRQGDRVSLVLYGDEAFAATPLTFDLPAVADVLAGSGIGMAGRATAIGDAIGMAIQTLRSDTAPEKAIILLSDGTNNAGTAEPESAAKLAATLGIRIHSIGLGSADQVQPKGGFSTVASADLDEDTLKAIADTSGGSFFRATTSKELVSVYQIIHELEGAQSQAPPLIIRSDLRHIPLILLLICTLGLAILQRLPGKPLKLLR